MSKRIYINPGHSDQDPGAVGYETERRLNVKCAEFLNRYLLENYDCQTRMNPGTINSVREVAADANGCKADLLVSIHFNAGGGDGYEALVYSSGRVSLGKVFEKYVLAAGQNSRGVKLRPDLGILRLTNMPAIVNEGAFVDNKKDIADWNEDGELEKLAISYAMAAAEHLQLPGKSREQVLYRVQVGAYSDPAGAKTMQAKLKAAGFEGIVVKGNRHE